MAEFKQSKLMTIAPRMLTQDAMDFVDACMGDFDVDEVQDGDGVMYELRGMLTGIYNGQEVSVTQTYYGDLSSMVALIEHLALTNKLLNEYREKNI